MKTALEYSPIWGMSVKEITRLCKEGRVAGAELQIVNGKATWMMPDGLTKPTPQKSGPKPKK